MFSDSFGVVCALLDETTPEIQIGLNDDGKKQNLLRNSFMFQALE